MDISPPSVNVNALLSDDDLHAKYKRLIKQAEFPVQSTGQGASQVTLGPRNVEDQLRAVMCELHRRGLEDLSEHMQATVPLVSRDPRGVCIPFESVQ